MDHHHHQPQQQEQDQQVDLEVVGRHALLFDDDSTSAFINSSDALVPWSGGDQSLLIDRYDARHLLQQLPPPRASRRQQQQDRQVEPDGVSRAELDLERFRDLESGGSGEDDEDEVEKKSREVAKTGAYRTVPFSYGASGDLNVHDDGLKNSGYHPPFPVPEYLLSNLPPTEKVHQIISRTAKFVSEHGGQSEIILRVKQGDNPTFGFLMPDHELHAYFRFLVGHPELAKGVTDSADRQEGKKKSASVDNELHVVGGALSLLGSVYGSGEDDGGVQDIAELKEAQVENAEDVAAAALPYRSPVPSSSFSEKTKTVMKLPTAAREKPLPTKKGRSSITLTAGAAQSKTKDVSGCSVNLFTNKPEANNSDPAALILEPPSSLKRMVDKTVEFILRNGKEFEASLIEQDKTNEKFPFLRPSNQYHSYYLKVLQDARESRLPRKNLSDQRNLSMGHVRRMTEIRGTVSHGSLSDGRDMMNQFEGSYQLDRKEKFRMVIGGSKKDANNSTPKPAKVPGLSAEEAAAIVMTATRGRSNQSISDSAPKTSVDDSIRVAKATGGHRSSSHQSFSSLPDYCPVSNTNSEDKAGGSLPVKFSQGTGKPGKESCNTAGGVLVANVIAKTVAGEADSSDAHLTKEQKVKMERLKRAKMFAAMIKSKHKTSELLPAAIAQSGSQVAAASSVLSGQESDLAGEREGISVPVDAEISVSEEKSHGKASKYEINRDCSQEKDVPMSNHHMEDPKGEHKQSRKRHRSKHSSHSNRDGHKHKHRTSHRHRHHVSSEDEHSHSGEDKRKRKRHSSSKHNDHDFDEDELRDREGSESRHHHEHHRSSNDESRKRKGSHRHHKKFHTEENQNLENKGDSGTSNLSKHGLLNLSNDIQEVAQPLVSEAVSSVATNVPDDLRAKIRAMLLETM